MLFIPWIPGSGSGMNLFRILDHFDYDSDFALETIRSKKKLGFHFSAMFRDPGCKNVWIRNEKMFGSGIPDPQHWG
jgi:hypothetical protein